MQEEEKQALDELRSAVIGQKTASLPEEPDDEKLLELYQLLTDFDAFVSQLVITILQGRKVDCEYGGLDRLNTEMQRAAQESQNANQRVFRKFSLYKDRLDRMYELACKITMLRSRNEEGEPK